MVRQVSMVGSVHSRTRTTSTTSTTSSLKRPPDKRRAPPSVTTRGVRRPHLQDARQVTLAFKEFVAHSGAVNCLALGHKSGRVLATGGDDKKVNLWAVGKPNCILSLSGHTTSIECVRFGGSEELVCAGSQSGALKIWDLEATKIVRTLTGHKSGIRSIDFHPYGDFIGTGSLDTNIKLWDIRRRGCIFTYKGHSEAVNGIKFSPDGQWIASAGEDSIVKLWDLRAGKMLTEFMGHQGPVQDVEFHPHEFLLASASLDRTVNFWDLEKFQLVSSSHPDTGPIRAVCFDPSGEHLYAGCPDVLRLYGWEPARTIDTLAMGWGKVADLAVANTQLIGASYQGTNVSLYVVELRRLQQTQLQRGSVAAAAAPALDNTMMMMQHQYGPGGVGGSNFRAGAAVRKSFSKDKDYARANAEQMKTEDASDTGGEEPPEEDPPPNILNLNAHREVFGAHRELQRTPPPEPPSWSNNNEPVSVSGEVVGGSATLPRRASTSTPSTMPAALHHRPFTAPRESLHASPITRSVSSSTVPQQVSGGRSAPPERRASAYDAPAIFTPLAGSDDAGAHRPRAVSESRRAGVGLHVQPSSPSEPQLAMEGSALLPPTMSGGSYSPHSPPNSLPQLTPRPPDVTNTSRSLTSSKPDLTQHPAYRTGTHHSPDLTRQVLEQYHHHHHMSQSDLSSHRTPVMMSTAQQNSRNSYNRQASQPVEISYMGTPKEEHRASHPNISYLGTPKDYGYVSSKYREDSTSLLPERGPMKSMNAFDDCLPLKLGGLSMGQDHVGTLNILSESEVLSYIAKGHTPMLGSLVSRARLLRTAYSLWQSKDLRSALDNTLSAADLSAIVDLLNVINQRPFIWNLDIVTTLLPSVSQLLQSRHESYVTVGCNSLKLMLKNFGSMIRSNMSGPVHSVGVDISREERRNKCIESYNMMMSIRALVQKRQTLSGTLGHTYRELYILMQVFD
ncbi:katanin p80 WD40 repeat-containing subunit B1 isoform X2 [Hyalella azteca]|uniref:Katanin p80 WD40 repeat-containing subunit B1 n=1 Tax=Hyalella azteca TaxID=294128 RepID=A0A979FRL7_HYAAZ|nr:katanin p80 WD40 repeat-containing subunit B1 isoform X2 [Hyalella azteca]